MNYKATALKIAHHEHVTDILDNGHTIQVTVEEVSTLFTERGTYQLKQFHFHTPSEHTRFLNFTELMPAPPGHVIPY